MPENTFQKLYQAHARNIEKRLTALIDRNEPSSVYDPIRYVLNAGGKRLRSVLVLLSCGAVGCKTRNALDAAAAIEILHNFTLVHDDVMDNAAVRRGRPTVHTKWDDNVAILAGDELIAQAYRSLLKTRHSNIQSVLHIFTDAFIQVCEGQGLDKEFEGKPGIKLDEYLLMISLKTGRIISAACEMGAVLGNGTAWQVKALRAFGEHLGRAFQIQDDLLDVAGDEDTFGKTIGGDIVEGKKTFLLLTALERARGKDRSLLKSLRPGNGTTATTVRRVREVYERTGTVDAARSAIIASTQKAQRSLEHLPHTQARAVLHWLSDQLVERTS